MRGSRKLGQGYFKYGVEVARDIVVPHADHAVTEFRQLNVTPRVCAALRMWAAVDFDHKPRFAAQEVHEIRAQWRLSDEFEAAELAITQPSS